LDSKIADNTKSWLSHSCSQPVVHRSFIQVSKYMSEVHDSSIASYFCASAGDILSHLHENIRATVHSVFQAPACYSLLQLARRSTTILIIVELSSHHAIDWHNKPDHQDFRISINRSNLGRVPEHQFTVLL
jgi:hypothetical protein